MSRVVEEAPGIPCDRRSLISWSDRGPYENRVADWGKAPFPSSSIVINSQYDFPPRLTDFAATKCDLVASVGMPGGPLAIAPRVLDWLDAAQLDLDARRRNPQ